MKILLVCNKPPYPLKDGGAMAIYQLATGLHEKGIEVNILAMLTPKHSAEIQTIRQHLESIGIAITLVNVDTRIRPVKLLYNLFFSDMPYNAGRFVSKEFADRLLELIKVNQFNVIQFEGLYLSPYIQVVRHNTKAPLLMRAHNVEHEIWQRSLPGIRNPGKRFYLTNMANRLKKWEINLFNLYDAIVPITQRDANRIRQFGYNNKLHVAPFGTLPESVFQQEVDVIFNDIYYIGSLDWLPNQEGLTWFMEKVWPDIRDTLPLIRFWVAGRNAPAGFARYLTQKGINYCGEVPNVYDFIRGKPVMIAPLFSGSGMRIKIVEAMANGKAVVTTKVGAEGIDATNGQQFFIADTPGQFKDALQYLLTNRHECLKIGENAAKFVNLFLNRNKIIDQLVAFYKTLV